MNWNEIGTEMILGLIGLIVTGLGLISTYLINKFVKNDKLRTIMTSLNTLVNACVQEVYQTYVEELKDKNIFDKEAQEKAKQMCLDKIKKELPNDIKKWLEDNFEDIEDYLVTLVESAVVSLKVISR